MTDNGEFDRATPPVSQHARSSAPRLVDATGSRDVEDVLTRIWCDVLGDDSVGPDDDFYALGGDSILAIRAVILARERGLSLTVEELLQAGTIRTLAGQVRAQVILDEAPYQPFGLLTASDRALVGSDIVDTYPLTALQLGMLFHSEGTDPDTYHTVTSVVVRQPFDEARLRRCLAATGDRHEALRTSFDIEHFSVPVAMVHRAAPTRMTVVDLRDLSEARQAAATDEMLTVERATKIDWRRPPAVRFRVDVLSADAFRFTWTEHHALLDGWSSSSHFAELIRRYAGTDRFDDEPIPRFAEYVLSELTAQSSTNDVAFWSRYLDGAEPARMPRPSGPIAPRPLETVSVRLPAATTAELRDVARAAGLPVKALLVAVHAFALGRLDPAATEVIVGLVVHGRPERRGAESTLGLFLNTLPLRVRLGPSWLDVAEAATAAERAANAHRRLPTVDIQAAAGGLALDNAFYYTDYHVLDDLATRCLIDAETLYNDVYTSFPLLVEIAARAGGEHLTVVFQFRPDRWSPEQAQDFVESFLDAIDALRSKPRGAWQLMPVTPLVDGAPSAPERPGVANNSTMVDLFRARAEANPDRLAVSCPSETLTYGDLDERVERLSGVLRQRGMGSGSRIGVLLPRTPELVVAMLAVWRVGAALVPLDPRHPPLRNSGLIVDAAADMLVGTSQTLTHPYPCTTIDIALVDWTARLAPLAAQSPSTDDVAYVMYTSGSTGKPKGVVIEHGQLAAFFRAFVERIGLHADHTVLAWTTVTFDIALVELVLPLLVGARVELIGDIEGRDPILVRDRIVRSGVDVVQATATKLRVLIDVGWRGPVTVINGGETLPRAVAQALVDGGCTVWNAYGPTEATIYATAHRVEPTERGAVPIGGPLAGYGVRVRDDRGDLLPAGAIGELCLEGTGVSRGYLNAPALTAERFVRDRIDGQRYYRTGDLGRMRSDGVYEYHGRRDSQVKLRGARVELGEVEHALTSHPDVLQSVAVIEEGPAGKRLVAHVVSGNNAPSADELRRHVARQLPREMVPARIELCAHLPMTVSGKVDRARLATAQNAPMVTRAAAGPATVWERTVIEVWCLVLGVTDVGRTDNFFDVGGDSLHLMRMVGQFARRGFAVGVADLAENQTVAEQARILEASPGERR